jgi:hypothetical protein
MFKASFSVFAYPDKRVEYMPEAVKMRELLKDIYIIEGIGSANVFLIDEKTDSF